MKTRRIIGLFLLSLCVFTSCKKEGENVRLKAEMTPYSGQKAYIDDDRYSCFIVGETMRINDEDVRISSVSNDDRTCDLSDADEASEYYAFYPASLLDNSPDLSSGFSSATVTLPRVQTYAENNGKQVIQNPMAASLDKMRGTLYFHNLCALLKVTVQSNTLLDSIVVSCNGATLWGTGSVNTNDWKINMNPNNSAQANTVSLVFPNGHSGNSSGKTYYLVVPHTTVAANSEAIKVQIYRRSFSAKSYALNLTSDATLTYNQIHTLDTFDVKAPEFSVSATQKVIFSPGNLQYQASTKTWRFAENQWDRIGNAKGNTTAAASRAAQSDWIDLFGWGTSGYNEKYPYMTSQTAADYVDTNDIAGTNYDWGKNAISNGGNKAGQWRTLTSAEWEYLLSTRKVTINSEQKASYGEGKVNGIYGLIILPDNWDGQVDAAFKYGSSAWKNTYAESTSPKWTEMAAAGCIFLPATGYRIGTSVTYVSEYGYYWSATRYNNTSYSYYLKLASNTLAPLYKNYDRSVGISVRLVKDAN